jgi:hypothetical protein
VLTVEEKVITKPKLIRIVFLMCRVESIAYGIRFKLKTLPASNE